MLKAIAIAFGRTPKPRRPELSIDPETVRAVVAERSHGNVRLQAGMFYTKDDVDAEYELVRGTEFLS